MADIFICICIASGAEGGAAPSEQEMDLWENGRLECLAKLTKWDDLAANTLEEVEHDTNR
jgi:hypothetical protein